MARTKLGYVAALVAGAAIVGAATFGVNAATTHQADVATAALAETQASLEAAAESAASAAEVTDQTSPAVSSGPSTDATTATSSAAPTSSATGPAGTAKASTTPTATTPTATPPTSKTTPKQSSAAPAPTPTKAANTYKDGQYSATTSYDSPGGQEQLGVTLTLKSDKVVKSDLQLLGGAGISHSYQALFASGYLPLVLGKDIDSISLGAVSGSSLTGQGFNEAVKKIEEQARAQA